MSDHYSAVNDYALERGITETGVLYLPHCFLIAKTALWEFSVPLDARLWRRLSKLVRMDERRSSVLAASAHLVPTTPTATPL